MNDLLVILCATKERGTMQEYLGQLKDARIDTHVEPILDFGEANCLGGQIEGERRLTRKFHHYKKIIFSDAFDVTFYGKKEDVLRKIPDGVLLAAERNCWPDTSVMEGFPGDTDWKYVNGGFLCGPPDKILDWLWEIEHHSKYRPKMCNQEFFNLIKREGSHLVKLDDRTELVYCLYHEQNELQFENGLPFNSKLGTHPNFIHANGSWPSSPIMARRFKSLKIRELKGARVPDSKMLSSVGLTIGLPFCGQPVAPEWALSNLLVNYPLNTKRIIHSTKGKEIGVARQEIAEEALKSKSKYLYFQDDDVSPPPHVIRSLISNLENADDETMVCAGIYFAKIEPTEPVVFRGEGLGAFWKWKVGDVFECTSIGTGCMLIKTEVFEQIERPWFKTVDKIDSEDGPGVQMNDDMYFCQKVREAGFKILADANVICTHWDWDSESSDFKFYMMHEGCYPIRPVTESEPRCRREL